MAQKRVQETKAAPAKQEAAVEEIDVVVDEEAAKLKAESDALMDEIDSLLEENASEFVAAYIQKGGE